MQGNVEDIIHGNQKSENHSPDYVNVSQGDESATVNSEVE